MVSPLQKLRRSYSPKRPLIFSKGAKVRVEIKEDSQPSRINEQIREYFPKLSAAPILHFGDVEKGQFPQINVCVIFSGGQAPGGHNVIAGLFDSLKSLNSGNKLYGFLGGPNGLLTNDYVELTAEKIAPYRNTGGFDMIGSGRTKLENVEQFDVVRQHCNLLKISGLVIIGGDDSNTNACLLAEYFLKTNTDIRVIGCPKTIDGDLKNEWVHTSFGFDTACKVYAELIGNICFDAMSAQKYWHFIKLMGRSASHIALECALQTHPDIVIISEEVAQKNLTLDQIVDDICRVITTKASRGLNYGIALIPEGLIEFIPEMKKLISELNDLLAHAPNVQQSLLSASEPDHLISCGLSADSSKVYLSLPIQIRSELVMDRDPHGNVQVAKIQTERMLIQKVEKRLESLKTEGKYQESFSVQSHYLGYEGRCAMPSNFDANYCYNLGYTAGALIGAGYTGYLASIKNPMLPISEWEPLGVPFTIMMTIEHRHGKNKPVIKKALVNLEGKPFRIFEASRKDWGIREGYGSPGPIQFFGPPELSDAPTITLTLEHEDHCLKPKIGS